MFGNSPTGDQWRGDRRNRWRGGRSFTPMRGRGGFLPAGGGFPPGLGEDLPPGMGRGTPPGMGRGMPPGMGRGMPPGMGRGMPPGMGGNFAPGRGRAGGWGVGGVPDFQAEVQRLLSQQRQTDPGYSRRGPMEWAFREEAIWNPPQTNEGPGAPHIHRIQNSGFGNPGAPLKAQAGAIKASIGIGQFVRALDQGAAGAGVMNREKLITDPLPKREWEAWVNTLTFQESQLERDIRSTWREQQKGWVGEFAPDYGSDDGCCGCSVL